MITTTPESSLQALIADAARLRAREPARARELAAEAVALARLVDHRSYLAQALVHAAVAELNLADHPAAERFATEALDVAREHGDRATEAVALVTLGSLRRRTGLPERALELFEEARALAIREGLRAAEGMALNALGHARRMLGEYEASLALHQQAATIAAEIDNADEEAGAWLGAGNTHERLGNYQEAIVAYERTLDLAERSGNEQLMAYASDNIGLIHERRGDVAVALEFSRRGLEAKERLGDKWGVGVSLSNIGVMRRYLGDYAGALDALVRCLAITEEIGDREGQSVALNCTGQVYEEVGDLSRALEYYGRSLAIAREIGYAQGEAYSLTHLGRSFQRTGDRPRALMHYLRALRMLETSGERYGARSVLADIGNVHADSGDERRAEEYYRRALELAEAIEDRGGLVSSLIALGRTALARRRREAESLLERALRLARESELHDSARSALAELASYHEWAGDPEAARAFRAEHQAVTDRMFNAEATRRVRELTVGVEQALLEKQARAMGLGDADVAEVIDAVTAQTVSAPLESVDGARPPATPVTPTAGAGIVVRTLGIFSVSVAGRPLEPADWRRRRARDLFKLLLINHRRTVTQDEIIDALWGGVPQGNGEMLVMNAVSHIRSALEPERRKGVPSRYLPVVDGSYVLDLGDDAWIDFLQFKELIVSARRGTDARERRELYEAAVALYRGDFLKSETYETWTESERDLLKDAYLEALEFITAEYLRLGDTARAQEAARAILACDDENEVGRGAWSR